MARAIALALAVFATPLQDSEPIVRRSTYAEGLSTTPVRVGLEEETTRGFLAFVDDSPDGEKWVPALLREGPFVNVKRVAKGATLFVLCCPHHSQDVYVDRKDRIVCVQVRGRLHMSSEPSKVMTGFKSDLGALEAGRWVVVIEDSDTVRYMPFDVGKAADDELAAFLTPEGDPAEHGLVAFACRAADYTNVRAHALGVADAPVPADLTSSQELSLFVLWGRRAGWPNPSGVTDRKSKAFRVTARWTGVPGMNVVSEAPYAGFGFKLGRLEAGKYSIEIGDIFPSGPDERRIAKAITVEVKP